MRNRIVLLLLLTLSVSLLFSQNADSQETQEAVVRVAPYALETDTQTVDIVIENGQNVTGYQVVLQYDSNSLTYVNSQFQHGDYLPNNAFFGTPKIIDIDPKDSLKIIRFAAVSYTSESNGNGILATIKFNKTGSSSLTLLGDIDGTLLANKMGEVSFPRLEHSVTSPKTIRDLVVESVQAIPIDNQGIPTGDVRHFYNKDEKFQLRVSVRNMGNVQTGVQNLIVSRSDSKDINTWSELDVIKPDPEIFVSPNRSVEVLLSNIVPLQDSGTYYYRVCVKATSWGESEGKEDENNCSTIKIVVEPPDLAVTKVWTEPSTVFPGEEIKLFAKVSHSGRKSEQTVLWYRFYRAKINGNTSSFEELRASRIEPLPLDDGKTEVEKETTVTAPKESGTYYYSASVDRVDGEENISNNSIYPLTILVQRYVSISDAELRKVIETILGKKAGETITPAEMRMITDLEANGKNITDLTGLEFATNLETLDLSNNQILDVNPLAGLTKLKELLLFTNKITDVGPLAGLKNLEVLDLSNNVASLVGLKNLKVPHKTTNAYGSTVYNYGDIDGNKAVLIKGLELTGWHPKAPDYTDPNYHPDENGEHFKIYPQVENHTCGHNSALMLLHYYGVKFDDPNNTTVTKIIGRDAFNRLARDEEAMREVIDSLKSRTDISLVVDASLFIIDAINKLPLFDIEPGYLVGPGTLPPEMAAGLKTVFPVDIEMSSEPSNSLGQDEFLKNKVNESCPPTIFLKLKEYGFHWVVVVGYDTKQDKFLIADPSPTRTGRFKWWEWKHQPKCGPALKNAWSLNYISDQACPENELAWLIGSEATEILKESEIAYYSLVPTEAPPYHHLKSQTFRIHGEGNFNPLIFWTETGWKWEYNFPGKVINCKQFFVNDDCSAPTVEYKDTKVTVSGTCSDGAVNKGVIDVYLTVYYEESGGSAPPDSSVALSEPLINTILLPNYPNPFNPETWIPYQLAKSADVTLTIYDIRGHVVRKLDLGHQRAGIYQNRVRAAHWDGRNAVGEAVASGVYFYTLQAGDFSATRKMLIRK